MRILWGGNGVGEKFNRNIAIEKPIALTDARIEPGLVDLILDDVGDEPGNLPLLEHALLQLWDARQGELLTHEAYHVGETSQTLGINGIDPVYIWAPYA